MSAGQLAVTGVVGSGCESFSGCPMGPWSLIRKNRSPVASADRLLSGLWKSLRPWWNLLPSRH